MRHFLTLSLLAIGLWSASAFALPPDTLWTHRYVTAGTQSCMDAIETEDGGNVLVGTSDGNWMVLRVDGNGNQLWVRTFDFGGDDRALAVIQGTDGDFYVGGTTYAGCMRLARVNAATGDTLWTKRYNNTQICRALCQTPDGGFALGGVGNYDFEGDQFVLIKTNANGDSLWSRRYGGSLAEDCNAIVNTRDGGLALAGIRQAGSNNFNYWLVKTNAVGDTLWTRQYGGFSNDYCYDIIETADGGYAMSGETRSYGAGGSDYWLVKTDEAGNVVWNRTFGTSGTEISYSVHQLPDGGYLLGGHRGTSPSEYDIWLVRTNGFGDSLWTMRFVAGGWEESRAAGFGASGYWVSGTYGGSSGDFWLARLRSDIQNEPGTPQLEVSMWLHRRTAHYSILQCGFSQGTYNSSNRGVRLFFGEHNLDNLDYMRFFDVNGNQLLNRRITYPSNVWIKITLKRFENRTWMLIWDDGGPNQVSAQVTDGFAVFDNPHFWVHPTGYYSETGGFYLDDIQGRFTHNGVDYLLSESWDDGDWTSSPEWFEYDNQQRNFGINATRGHNAVPCLEGWSGNTGTDYTALYTPFVTQRSLTVVGPGFGDEWRVGQWGAGVEWSAENLSCCIKVDLYHNGTFVMNLAPCVPAERDTLSVDLPCDLAAGYGYQIYVEATCDPSVNDLGDPFLIRPCDYGFAPDANTVALYKFNECTGNIAHDISGNAFDLQLLNGAGWWRYGQCGTAADLTDPDAKLNSAHIIGTGWNALTLEAWIKPTQIIPGTHHPIIARYRYYTSNPAYIFELNGDGRLYGCVYNNAGQLSCVNSAPGIVAEGDSHHVALTWSAGRPSQIWVDGLLVASSGTAMSGVIGTSTDPLTVGWYHDTGYGDFYFQGYMDEVRISNIARYPLVSLAVVGPGFGDEWRVGQYGASVEWDAVNVTGCIKVDLYRNNSFVMNIASCVPAAQETLSWNVPCDMAQGQGYQIYVESNSNPSLNDLGNPFRIRENYAPEPVSNLVVQSVGSDAHLFWSPVESDVYGNPLCPHVYLVFFEDDQGEDWDFHGWTADTTYVHAGVVQFSPRMFYNVEVFIGNVGLLAGATAELGERIKRSQLMSYLKRHW